MHFICVRHAKGWCKISFIKVCLDFVCLKSEPVVSFLKSYLVLKVEL